MMTASSRYSRTPSRTGQGPSEPTATRTVEGDRDAEHRAVEILERRHPQQAALVIRPHQSRVDIIFGSERKIDLTTFIEPPQQGGGAKNVAWAILSSSRLRGL